ncbi:hypothetical protein [Thaumasiovibrio sp. DFM-14]|uniref:hypothetical protein n=1 Tax=Thaumasiovibrio sp. DFM-14 TaxID=3384792 RepID=UPI0039A02413
MHVFPSTTHLLPGGNTVLDLNGLDECQEMTAILDDSHVFVLCMLDESQQRDITTLSAIGTVVKQTGMIIRSPERMRITIEGCYKVELLDITHTEQHLLYAEIRRASNWAATPITPEYQLLADKLFDLFQSVPIISDQYGRPEFEDVSWVSQRWIEILPLESIHKRMLISQPTPQLAQRFLLKLLTSETWI